MPTSKRIRAAIGFSRTSDFDVLTRGRAVYAGMNGSKDFSKPPIAMDVFKDSIDKFSTAISNALDGGRMAFAEKRRCRDEVVGMLEYLGRYAENACNDNEAVFVSSGFEKIPAQPGPTPATPQPKVLKIENGRSGELLVSITPFYRKVRYYQLRYAATPVNGTDDAWSVIMLHAARAPVSVTGLTPATIYAFQVRAFGPLGHSDWSDSVTRMCT